MNNIFKYVHPVLLVSLGLFVAACILLRGQGGPCASPLILLFAPIELGILIGFVMSLVRVVRLVRQKGGKR